MNDTETVTPVTTSPPSVPQLVPKPLDPIESAPDPNKQNLSSFDKIMLRSNLTWSKFIAILLTLQGLYGLYKSITFILVEYPILESQLASHIISQEEVNSFASKAIITVTLTILSMFFAVRFSVIKSKATKILHKAIIAIFFIANTAIMKYLNQIGSADIINNLTLKIIDFFRATL